jgi:hypothetical protein
LTIIKESSVRFYKHFDNLNISIKNSLQTSIIFKVRKHLEGNFYKPIKINNKILIGFNYYLKIMKYRIITLIKK